MKATELQIGDWVCYDGDTEYTTPVKVDGLTTDDISLDGEGFLGGIEDMVIPIPLTPEILEKNGWNDEMHRFYNDDTFCELDLRIDNGHYTWVVCGASVCSFTYVHELQHALRLCGLNDEADNFKVE